MEITEINLHGPSNTISFKVAREGKPGHRVTVTDNGDPKYLQEEIDRQMRGFEEKPDLTLVKELAETCFKPDYNGKETFRPAEPANKDVMEKPVWLKA